MSDADQRLPGWVTWQARPFPDANLLLFDGYEPALVDGGFVGHARDTHGHHRSHIPTAKLGTTTGHSTTTVETVGDGGLSSATERR